MSAGDLGSRRPGRAGLARSEPVEPHVAKELESGLGLSIDENRAPCDHDRLMAWEDASNAELSLMSSDW